MCEDVDRCHISQQLLAARGPIAIRNGVKNAEKIIQKNREPFLNGCVYEGTTKSFVRHFIKKRPDLDG